jgi:hypothetical protein
MPARSTAYYLLLKHTSRTVDSYCSFMDIHLLRTPPCYVQLALHLVEGWRATTGTYPSCQRCCAASKEVWGTSAEHSGKTKGARPTPPLLTSLAPIRKGIAYARMQSARFGEGAWACRRTLPSVLKKSFK